jgi:hypothetical protein
MIETLRDYTHDEAESHRQLLAAYRPDHQAVLDAQLAAIDALLAGACIVSTPVDEAESPRSLREHCKAASALVATWPEWKSNCLGGNIDKHTDCISTAQV